MNRHSIIIMFSLLIISCQKNSKPNFEELLFENVGSYIDSITIELGNLESYKDLTELKEKLKQARRHYKTIEPFVEYYFQGISRRINGPALPEIKTEDNVVNEATGFQVIEEIIYTDPIDHSELNKHLKILKTDMLFVKNNITSMPAKEHHIYEILQHQIIRIASLGITGFDSPVALNSLEEAIHSLNGISQYYQLYNQTFKKNNNPDFLEVYQNSVKYIKNHNQFNEFNRLTFIKEYLMPLSTILEVDFKSVIDKNNDYAKNKVFCGNLSDLMQGKKLNPDAFSAYADAMTTEDKIKVGKILFHSKKLSNGNDLSCASCHKEEMAFTDGKKTSIINIHNTGFNRNSPTLFYSAFQKSFFYDLRAQDLENQIESVMRNPDEFNLSPEKIRNKILLDTSISKILHKAYPKKEEITAYEIRNAIASYVRSLMPFKSKLDKYFRGEKNLNESEINGFNLFTGKGKCATCHFIPIFNGTIPPWYNNTESEVIGVPKSIEWKNAEIDPDQGRYIQNKIEQLRFSFKTPTVRNIEKTSPYMHNGVYKTLDDVIQFYNLGGGNGIGMKLEYQTLPFDELNLSNPEKKDLINFMKTLTDEY